MLRLIGGLMVLITQLGLFACAPGKEGADTATASTPDPGPGTIVQVDWGALDTIMERQGVLQAGDVYRFSMPRSDMSVTAQGVRVRPAFALGSWIAFKATSSGAVAMGDLVLKESELAAVMSRLQEAGIEQTAIHHHLLYENPRVVYMHVHGHGDAAKLAEGVKAALTLTTTPPAGGAPQAAATELGLDTAQVAAILGRTGRVNGGVYQVGVPRAEVIRDAGVEIPPTMGLGTAINFQPTDGGRAAITGDFVMIAAEVNAVIRALRANDIEVTSLHNHLLSEEPRLFFMHFWAHDDALKLARGLRAALDLTNSQPPNR